MTSFIEYNGYQYETAAIRAGQRYELNHSPEISGEILGRNGDDWLIRLTVPYGKNSKVYVVIPEPVILFDEDREAFDQQYGDKE